MNRVSKLTGHLGGAAEPAPQPRAAVQQHTTAAAAVAVASSRPAAVAPPPHAHQQQYRYTVNANNVLTPEEREAFERDGFFVRKNMLTPDEIATYRARFKELVEQPAKRPPTMTVMVDVELAKKKGLSGASATTTDVVTKLQDWQDDPVLFTYCENPRILDVVEAIIGGPSITAGQCVLTSSLSPGSRAPH